jgi:predicted ester cyclase
MSIEENKAIVRRYQEIYNSNNLDVLAEVVSEELITPKIMPGIPSGFEGAKVAHQIMLAGFPDYQTVIDALIAEGDQVVARISNGKIVVHWGEEDGVGLLAQLGVLKL